MTWVANRRTDSAGLLCPPTYFSLQPINEITRDVLAAGETVDLAALAGEHEDLIVAYRTLA